MLNSQPTWLFKLIGLENFVIILAHNKVSKRKTNIDKLFTTFLPCYFLPPFYSLSGLENSLRFGRSR